jgi:hypothetical protein
MAALKASRFTDIDKGGVSRRLGEQFVEQGMGSAIDRLAGDDVIALPAELQQGAGDGRHTAGRDLGGSVPSMAAR